MSIVFDKMKTKMNLIKEYQKNNNLNFSLSLSDATEEQLKNNTDALGSVEGATIALKDSMEEYKKQEYERDGLFP